MNDQTAKKIWRIMNSRSVVPVVVVKDIVFHRDTTVSGYTKGDNYVIGFATKEKAVTEARKLIDNAELRAKAQLLNVERHRLHLEKSIKEHNE